MLRDLYNLVKYNVFCSFMLTLWRVIISKDFLLFPRTIGNAALAIVKGYIRPVDVMEIKVSFYYDWNWKYHNAIKHM